MLEVGAAGCLSARLSFLYTCTHTPTHTDEHKKNGGWDRRMEARFFLFSAASLLLPHSRDTVTGSNGGGNRVVISGQVLAQTLHLVVN